MPAEVVEFRGIKFRRYPESRQLAHRMYFTPGSGDRARGVEDLHREIWKDAHGPIPDGYHVHHDDGDSLNNDPANLVCLSHDEHVAAHAGMPGFFSPERRAVLDSIRPLAAAWHRTDEGRAWHRQHGRDGWAEREPIARACVQCGQQFDSITRRPDDRFCSNACKSAWRRASGLDDEQRTCAACGATFTANRYSRARTCSGRCAWSLRLLP